MSCITHDMVRLKVSELWAQLEAEVRAQDAEYTSENQRVVKLRM